MPRFAANISLLFSELPYLDRFGAAADAGFKAVEILFPYENAARDTREALSSACLELVLINAPPPNYTGGAPGFAAIPGGEERFRHDMRRVMRYADALKPGLIHIMAGYEKGAAAKETFLQNLCWVADTYPEQKFTIEPLNGEAQPGYFLDDYDLAVELLDQAARQNLGLQYDSYHAQMIHGDALKTWERYGDRAFHVQIGAAPDRSEPGRGMTDFPLLFALIDQSGYAGWVSAEYNPSVKRTEATLDWMLW